MVSGRVVATVTNLSVPLIGYFTYHRLPVVSTWSTSSSESAVPQRGHQFTM